MQYLAQMAHVSRHIIEQLKGLAQKNSSLTTDSQKLNNLIDEYYDGRLKDIDIDVKFKALKLAMR